MPTTPNDAHRAERPADPGRAIAAQLLLLRAAGALDLRETGPRSGVWAWRFRAGGWPVDVVLDDNVLEMRVYHGRDEVAMSRIPAPAMNALLGREPARVEGQPPRADDVIAELRRLVAGWKAGNARIFTVPPQVVGHPDNWNRA